MGSPSTWATPSTWRRGHRHSHGTALLGVPQTTDVAYRRDQHGFMKGAGLMLWTLVHI